MIYLMMEYSAMRVMNPSWMIMFLQSLNPKSRTASQSLQINGMMVVKRIIIMITRQKEPILYST